MLLCVCIFWFMCHCLRVDWVQWLIWSRFNHCSGLVLTLILCSYFCTLRVWVRWIMWVLYYFMWSHISCPCPLCGSWGWLAPHLTTTRPLGTIARVALFFRSFPFLSFPFLSLPFLFPFSSLFPFLPPSHSIFHFLYWSVHLFCSAFSLGTASKPKSQAKQHHVL